MALTVVAVTGALVVRQAATEQALAEAKQLTDVSARLVERRVNEGLLTGDAETLGAVASVVFDAVKVDPIVRVKIWSRDGTIVYSDQTELIGSTYDLGEDELDVIDQPEQLPRRMTSPSPACAGTAPARLSARPEASANRRILVIMVHPSSLRPARPVDGLSLAAGRSGLQRDDRPGTSSERDGPFTRRTRRAVDRVGRDVVTAGAIARVLVHADLAL